MIAALSVLALVYWFVLRRWFRRWGATDLDVMGPMPGDVQIANASYVATLAVDISAPVECIWPWLVQIGYRRGGLYSYDWLDRLFGFLDAPSAEELLPEFQTLRPGDEIPMGRGPSFPVKT